MKTTRILEVSKLNVSYGQVSVLQDISISVSNGELVSIVGANGAGKSTLLHTISGLIHPRSGNVMFQNEDITLLAADKIVERGLLQVPESRHNFPYMTVRENLELGAYSSRARKRSEETLKDVFRLLPLLQPMQSRMAATLSGGEQQVLAIGRGLMAKPALLILDEPSLGLAPLMVRLVFDIAKKIHSEGVSVILVEQNVGTALSIADRGYVLENGKIVLEGTGAELLANQKLKKAYLGI